jgi:hypothetical protein
MEFSKATHKECSPITLCEVLLLHKFQTWRRSEFFMWQLSGRRHIYQRELCTKCISFRPLCMARSLKSKTELIIFVSKLCDVGSYLRNVSEWNHCHEVTLRSSSCALNYVIVHHQNIKEWNLWSVPSPQLQLLSPTLLRSSNCSPSLRSVVVWFQRDSVLWHSLQVLKPVPSVFYLV